MMSTVSCGGRLKDLAVKLFEIDAVKFGDFEAKIGRNTPVYFDLRVIVSYPDVMITVADLLQGMVKPDKTALVCGVPYTALPLATIISVNTKIPMLMRRKEIKKYGTKNKIEGHFKKGQNCLIIEDVVTSGGSIMETICDLRNEGLAVTDAVIVLDREQGGASVLRNHGIELRSLFTLSGLVEMLLHAGKISQDTALSVTKHIAEIQFNAHIIKDNHYIE